MADTDWRSELGFPERMASIMKLKTAYKEGFPSLSSAELQTKASGKEEAILNRASSIDEYKVLCQSTCMKFGSPQPTEKAPPNTDASLLPSNQPFQTVGPFKAQFHASGLFSTIYRSTSPTTGSAIAIKLSTPSRMGAPHDSERESRLLSLARASPFIVPLLSTQWIAGGHFYLTFPFLPFDLGGLLDDQALTPPQIRMHLHSLFSALAHIHSLGIIHRDIKPSNLLLASPAGPAKLADFGISWHAEDPASEPADAKITDVGTTCYRAPELLFGFRGYGTKLDAWGAGCVVAECLRGGRPLFDAGDLGSELALISSMFRTVGTPSDEDWPEARGFPDWGKMEFKQHLPRSWADILPDADEHGRDLVASLVVYESGRRLEAKKTLEHPFFKDVKSQG